MCRKTPGPEHGRHQPGPKHQNRLRATTGRHGRTYVWLELLSTPVRACRRRRPPNVFVAVFIFARLKQKIRTSLETVTFAFAIPRTFLTSLFTISLASEYSFTWNKTRAVRKTPVEKQNPYEACRERVARAGAQTHVVAVARRPDRVLVQVGKVRARSVR